MPDTGLYITADKIFPDAKASLTSTLKNSFPTEALYLP